MTVVHRVIGRKGPKHCAEVWEEIIGLNSVECDCFFVSLLCSLSLLLFLSLFLFLSHMHTPNLSFLRRSHIRSLFISRSYSLVSLPFHSQQLFILVFFFSFYLAFTRFIYLPYILPTAHVRTYIWSFSYLHPCARSLTPLPRFHILALPHVSLSIIRFLNLNAVRIAKNTNGESQVSSMRNIHWKRSETDFPRRFL